MKKIDGTMYDNGVGGYNSKVCFATTKFRRTVSREKQATFWCETETFLAENLQNLLVCIGKQTQKGAQV